MKNIDNTHLAPVWPRIVAQPIVATSGKGVWLHTEDGRTFLDFTSGIGVTGTGHCHPRVVAAIQEQAAQLIHGQMNIVYHEPALRLTHALAEIVPEGLDTFFFANSGAEIVEAAVKLVKQATGRPNIIVFSGSFHGRTHLAMSMTTSRTIYRARYQPLVPGVFVAPYPYAFRFGWDADTTTDFCLDQLRHLLNSQTAPEETAAIFLEPVLGEGGYVVPPKRFVQELRALCDEHDILLVADEIQSGFGRTGRWFCVEHFGVVPDVICMAKGMASGMPISCLAARRDLFDAQAPGSHGGTYGGNPIACAAAHATIETIRDERLLDNAAAMGARLISGLSEIAEEFPAIGEVRGLGLMVATELVTHDRRPNPALASAVTRSAFDNGLLLLTCGTYGNVIRWIPPLVAREEDIHHALDVFRTALRTAHAYA